MENQISARISEIEEKQERARRWMKASGLGGLLLRRHRNLYWATAGGGNPVIYGSDPGFQSVLFTGGKRYIISQQVEMPRLKEEETAGLGFEYVEFNWWEEDLPKTVSSLAKGAIGCDLPLAGMQEVEASVAALRPDLTPWEVERFRSLGRDASACLEQTCRELSPGMTELEVGARLLDRLYRMNIRAPVMLVGSDERVFKYRHPVATQKQVQSYVMIVVCAERGGLIAPTTRLVHFGTVPQELEKRYTAVRQVAATLNLCSRPGSTIGSAFQEAVKAYADNGFEDEWKRHYQGGVCGYLAREVGASPGGTFAFRVNQVLGWNPTITGTKIEDAYVIREQGLENITLTSTWPCRRETVALGSLVIPDILVR